MSSKRKSSELILNHTASTSKKSRNDDSEVSNTPRSFSEGEAGLIEYVGVKNFMCHSRLEFPIAPNVNIIIGHNGSGKSAVMSALIVGLGGKANVTSRGNSLKTFIKHGKSSAEVTIKLRNRGQDAFKPELYGNTIQIERTLKSDGGGQYKLLGKDGKVKSRKREDLDRIVDHFNIQVNNPVAVLNQDTSRNFLHSKDSKDKYKFFLKATQLEQIKNDYSHINEQKEITKGTVLEKEQSMPILEREVLKWEKKYKALESIDGLKEKVEKMKDEIAWALVNQKEKAVAPLKKELLKEEARIPKFLQKVTEHQEKVDESMRKFAEIQEELRLVSQNAETLEPQLNMARTKKSKLKSDCRKAENEAKGIENERRGIVKDRDETSERIEELRNTAQKDYDTERLEREAKIAELEERHESILAQQRTMQHEVETFRKAVDKYKEDLYPLTTDEQDLNRRINETKRRVQNLKSSSSNRLKRFGSYMPDLLSKIENANKQKRFHKKPKGPLGASISLKDQKWALSVEACIGQNTLMSFCCHNSHDAKVMDSIIKEIRDINRPPSIIITPFLDHVHDVSRLRVQSNHPAVWDILHIDDPVIANALIDQRGIENIILISNVDEARNIMMNNPPQNCKEAYVPEGDQLLCKPTFRYYSNINIKHAQYLKGDIQDDIRNCEDELKQLQQQHTSVKGQVQTLNGEIRGNQDEERRATTRLMRLNENFAKLKREIRDLKEVQDPEPVDVAALEKEVSIFNSQIEELETRKGEAAEKVNTMRKELKEAENELKELENQIHEVAENVEPLKENLTKAEEEIRKTKSQKTHYDKHLKELETNITVKRKVIEDKETELKTDIEKAEQICPRVTTGRSPKVLESEIKAINKQIETHENIHGNKEEIINKYHETVETYKNIQKDLSQLKEFIKLLDKVMNQRQVAYVDFRHRNAMRAKMAFIVKLNSRHYVGSMAFDHDNEKLSLSVRPTAKEGEGAKDMRSLSGGERSFSTVCFILALWDIMESPFRCLDEFDVFMDMVNRRISMDMMMDVANLQRHRQFIFLTPQDMSRHEMKSFVKIYRMPDPDRGQGVLPFEPVNEHEEEGDDIPNTQ